MDTWTDIKYEAYSSESSEDVPTHAISAQEEFDTKKKMESRTNTKQDMLKSSTSKASNKPENVSETAAPQAPTNWVLPTPKQQSPTHT